jgi:hypothetical protein
VKFNASFVKSLSKCKIVAIFIRFEWKCRDEIFRFNYISVEFTATEKSSFAFQNFLLAVEFTLFWAVVAFVKNFIISKFSKRFKDFQLLTHKVAKFLAILNSFKPIDNSNIFLNTHPYNNYNKLLAKLSLFYLEYKNFLFLFTKWNVFMIATILFAKKWKTCKKSMKHSSTTHVESYTQCFISTAPAFLLK